MRTSHRVPAGWSLIILVASVLHAPSASAQDRSALPDSTLARIDALFARWHAPDDPGCAVAASRGGRTLLRRAYGVANLEDGTPNTPSTIFEAGSVSKQFTAAAVVLLAQRGRLSLDDDVRRYIPELPDYGTPIRLRHMLNHTSGLRDWGTVVAAAGWPRGRRVHTHAHVLDVAAKQRALNYPPGAEYLYSNTNYNLLAIIVDRVSGMPFAEFTRRNLFEPLGMASTSWRDDYTRVVKGRSTAYDRGNDGQWHSDMPFENVHGNGGLLTTVDDLLTWSQSFDDTTLGRAFVDSMQRRGRLTNGSEIRYALGLVIDRYRGVPEVSHSGATAGYRAYLARYPQQRVVIALLCNAGNVGTTSRAHDIVDILLGDVLSPVDADSSTHVVPSSILGARAGLYRSERDGYPMRLVLDHGRLRVQDGPPLRALSDTTFRIGTGTTIVTFDRPATSSAERLLWPTHDGDTTRYARVKPWTPSAAELRAFAGEFTSPDADVTYRIVPSAAGITVRWSPDGAAELRPVYRDAFWSPDEGLLWFHRDARDRITGFSVGLGRVRDLRFTKTG